MREIVLIKAISFLVNLVPAARSSVATADEKIDFFEGHDMEKCAILTPQFIPRFRCTAAACDANCCRGLVDVDKATYLKFISISEPGIRKKMKRVLFLNKPSERRDNTYARIDNGDKPCIFLVDNLCEIQQKLGEDYLTKMCFTVPRKLNRFPGLVEISCKMSCPEAARLALDNPDPLSFDLTESELDSRYHIVNDLTDAAVEKMQPGFFSVRDYAIDILQERRYSFGERIIRLGGFISLVDGLVADSRPEAIDDVIDQMRRQTGGRLDNLGTANDCLNYLDFIHQVFVLPTQNANGEKYREMINGFSAGLGIEGNVTQRTAVLFQEAWQNTYLPFMRDHDYIYEHYFVLYIFSRQFPLRSQGTAFDEYLKLTWFFLILHTLLIGMAAHHGGLTKEFVCDFIAAYSRIVENHEAGVQLLRAVKHAGLDKLDPIITLLRPVGCQFSAD